MLVVPFAGRDALEGVGGAGTAGFALAAAFGFLLSDWDLGFLASALALGCAFGLACLGSLLPRGFLVSF